jgi:hypothetical protein
MDWTEILVPLVLESKAQRAIQAPLAPLAQLEIMD